MAVTVMTDTKIREIARSLRRDTYRSDPDGSRQLHEYEAGALAALARFYPLLAAAQIVDRKLRAFKDCAWCSIRGEGATREHTDTCWVPGLRAAIEEATGE